VREWFFFPLTDQLLIISNEASSHQRRLVNVTETSRDTTLCLAAAHALVRLDDGTIVGDPMEKTTLESLDWTLGKGVLCAATNIVVAYICQGYRFAHECHCTSPYPINYSPSFQFSSALKRMSTVSVLPGGKVLATVKGAPETIKTMLSVIPEHYDDTYKWFNKEWKSRFSFGDEGDRSHLCRQGQSLYSAVWSAPYTGLTADKQIGENQVESKLIFAGFLVFHCSP